MRCTKISSNKTIDKILQLDMRNYNIKDLAAWIVAKLNREYLPEFEEPFFKDLLMMYFIHESSYIHLTDILLEFHR